MSQQEIETRLQALEQAVAALERQLNATKSLQDDWIVRKSGSMREFPEWEEVCRLGAEWRKAQPMVGDDEAAEEDKP